MQIKSIKESIKPNYPTNNERNNSLIKFLFEHNKIILSLALAFLINNKKVVSAFDEFPTEIVAIDEVQILAGDQAPVVSRFIGAIQWGCYGIAIGFLIYEIIFNIINYKNFKSLSKDEKQKLTKKRIKKLILIVLLLFIIGTLFGWTVNYWIYKY